MERQVAPDRALALYFVFYNLCRVHKTLGVTPAMAAGLVDKVLKMADVVALIDAGATLSRSPGVSSVAFRAPSPDLRFAS
jgi:hypothetical protein